jgi:putative chitinase
MSEEREQYTIISPDQLQACMPNCRDIEEWTELLNIHLFEFGIVEPQTVAAFIAQVGHESMDLNVMEENLNYSGERLKVVFPKYFRNVDVNEYARQPEKIANRVYANRMGNGPEESGDGWRFRGSGPLQLTGYNNFKACSEYLYSDDGVLLRNPHHVRENKEVGLLTALWYWDVNGLRRISDFELLTRRINGGTHGLKDREDRYLTALGVFGD